MRPAPFSEDDVREAVAGARSYSEALRTLGYRVAGGNYKTLKKYVERWGISTEHFDPVWANRTPGRRTRIPLDEILVEHSTYSRTHLKDRLFEEGLKQRKCEQCGQDELWRGRHMALILDHVNGTGDDNRLENLRVLCPNCAATLDTHCGRKNLLARGERECGRCGLTFIIKAAAQRYCSQYCGRRASLKHKGVPRPERRNVARPPLHQLTLEVAALGYSGTGRKYGVSDNAVRKWMRAYAAETSSVAPTAVGGDGGRSPPGGPPRPPPPIP